MQYQSNCFGGGSQGKHSVSVSARDKRGIEPAALETSKRGLSLFPEEAF